MVLFATLGILPGFFFDMYSWTLILAFYLGWLAAPLTHILFGFVVAFFPRDSNPGWGDWRRSRCGWVGFCFWFSFSSKCESAIFACHATGLDAVQRLEQKKTWCPRTDVNPIRRARQQWAFSSSCSIRNPLP